jgi:hypothetical protein
MTGAQSVAHGLARLHLGADHGVRLDHDMSMKSATNVSETMADLARNPGVNMTKVDPGTTTVNGTRDIMNVRLHEGRTRAPWMTAIEHMIVEGEIPYPS